MASKKEMLARVSQYTGVTRVLEALPSRPALLILNYHRVGDPARTPYDSGTFSCTASEMDWQLGWLKRRFPIVDLHAAVEIVHGRVKPAHTAILLTFDDGYRDNYDEAFPVLKKHDVSATFFLPTYFVGTGCLPWWDEIAYLVKRSQQPRIRLAYPEAAVFELAGRNRADVVRDVLKLYKRAVVIDTERFLSELETACATARPGDEAERCFLSWDEARAMQAAGMCFGSHTHTHEILAKIPYERQLQELIVSQGILEQELRREIDTLAYPVGSKNSFNAETFAALRESDYKTAFSFYTGVNTPGAIDPLNVLRGAMEDESRSLLRLRTAMNAAFGSSLV